MFNSREYEWADLTFILGGKPIIGMQSIKYAAKQEKKVVYGKGNKPQKIAKGNISYEGELGVLQSELETLKLLAKDRSILSLQLDAIVSYGNPTEGDVLVTDMLIGIQFSEEAKEIKQGDTNMEIKLPFIFLDLKPAI